MNLLMRVEMCVESLNADVNIDVIHSDLSPAARNEAITRFRTGVSWVLIATDLLGRGLDFLGLNTVVNYDFPTGVKFEGI